MRRLTSAAWYRLQAFAFTTCGLATGLLISTWFQESPRHSQAHPTRTDSGTVGKAEQTGSRNVLSEALEPRKPHAADGAVGSDVLGAILCTPESDLVGVCRGIGALVRLDDAGALAAFRRLATRPPRSDYVGSLVAAYLWSRAARSDPACARPEGWGLENFPGLSPDLLAVRGLASIREALMQNRPVSFDERKAFFTQSFRDDPIGTFELWLRGVNDSDRMDEMGWFSEAVADPSNRAEAIRRLIRSGMQPEQVASLIDRLAGVWMLQDPQGYEQWLNDPLLASCRDRLQQLYIARRCTIDPSAAWALTEALPADMRAAARRNGSRVLAADKPDLGMNYLAGVTDPNERREIVKVFGESLAVRHFDKWKGWRDSLPPAEQDAVNEAAFESWVVEDVAGALEWLRKQPNGPAKTGMITETASRYAMDQPETMAEWIRTLPDKNDRLSAVIAGLRAMPADAHEDLRILMEAAN